MICNQYYVLGGIYNLHSIKGNTENKLSVRQQLLNDKRGLNVLFLGTYDLSKTDIPDDKSIFYLKGNTEEEDVFLLYNGDDYDSFLLTKQEEDMIQEKLDSIMLLLKELITELKENKQ